MTEAEWRKIFAYIEANIDDCTLNDTAEFFYYSSSRFHHLFTKRTGISFARYTKRRKIALAAKKLLYGTDSILDIAFVTGFQSQEAFSRAFKEEYRLSPAQFRNFFQSFTVKKETVGMSLDGIPNWFVAGSNADKFKVKLDRTEFYSGKQSVTLQSKNEAKIESGDFVTIMQQFSAQNYVEKRIRFTGYARTLLKKGRAGLWIRIDGHDMAQLKFDNMLDRPIIGETKWQPYSCVVDVPKEAEIINIGALLEGIGSVWVDQFSIEIVDETVTVTDDIYPKEPSNLSFEASDQR